MKLNLQDWNENIVKMIYSKIPEDVKDILKKGREHGDFYLVGGCVRDILLGVEPKDYDFATNLPYEEIAEIFKNSKPKEIGKAFGVISIEVNKVSYEIAKFRGDVGIPNDRREQEVKFTNSAREDMKRRDFTINSFFLNEEDLRYFGNAKDDLTDGILRLIGNKKERILSDPLRILRAFRFMATKKTQRGDFFRIEEETLEEIELNAHLIKKISQERIRDELLKIVMSDNVIRTFEKMHEVGVLEYILPELDKTFGYNQRSKWHTYDLAHHLLHATQSISKNKPLRLAMLFHDIAKQDCVHIDKEGEAHYYGHDKKSAQLANIIMTRLKIDNKTIKLASNLVALHMMRFNDFGKKAMRKWIKELSLQNMEMLFEVWIADENAHQNRDSISIGRANQKIKKVRDYISSQSYIETEVKGLQINGRDIVSLGFKGKEIGFCIEKLKDLVSEGLIKNERDILLEECRNISQMNEYIYSKGILIDAKTKDMKVLKGENEYLTLNSEISWNLDSIEEILNIIFGDRARVSSCAEGWEDWADSYRVETTTIYIDGEIGIFRDGDLDDPNSLKDIVAWLYRFNVIILFKQ